MKPGVDYIGVSVGAMIFNEKGELFLSKRSKNATNEHGCWEVPGGKVDFGETLQDAVKREIKEEYGVDIELVEQFPAANHLIKAEKQHWVPTTFLAKIKSGQKPKILEPKKCDAINWFNLDKLPKPLSIITKIDLEYFNNKKIRTMNEAQKLVKEFALSNDKATGLDRWKDEPNIDKFDHLHEELIEMSRHLRYYSKKERKQIIKDKKEIFIDGIGDLFFALCRLANQLNINIEEAFNIVKENIIKRYHANKK